MCNKIGLAKSAERSMYASTRGSIAGIEYS
jgi:hypothetical protein